MKSCLPRWDDCLLPCQLRVEHLSVVNVVAFLYVSTNPYQPTKCISAYDKELFSSTLINIIPDAKPVQNNKYVSATHSKKFYSDDLPAAPINIKKLDKNNNNLIMHRMAVLLIKKIYSQGHYAFG